MEDQVVRRRVNLIAGHIAAHEDISATATHLFPMSCSNSLNPVIRRCDSGMYFARQGSSSQACFMRQATNEQGRCAKSTTPWKSTSCANMDLYTFEVPMFSRPARLEPNLRNVQEIQSLLQACNYPQPMPEAPCFARPSKSGPQFDSEERKHALESNGFEWSPRMDVAESRINYVITVELPGVRVRNIKVQVSDQNLTVTGNRALQPGKITSCSTNSISAYHKKEISQGPYKIVWPLPTNVNKDSVSAEFVDGLLQITVPKLSEVRQPLKGYM